MTKGIAVHNWMPSQSNRFDREITYERPCFARRMVVFVERKVVKQVKVVFRHKGPQTGCAEIGLNYCLRLHLAYILKFLKMPISKVSYQSKDA